MLEGRRKKCKKNYGICATIRIGREIQCLNYVGLFFEDLEKWIFCRFFEKKVWFPNTTIVHSKGFSRGVSVAVAVGISVAMAVTAGFIGFGATIRTHQEIQWSHWSRFSLFFFFLFFCCCFSWVFLGFPVFLLFSYFFLLSYDFFSFF